ncbi:cytochrome C biosynthesis protein [Puteibacter caeruleilacunae]|nr:cytochrome C biosynthesis protein [Puteibacter caeruleilacunae]
MKTINSILLVVFIGIFAGCGLSKIDNYTTSDKVVEIFPDYTDITIPPNIAPLNFKIQVEADEYFVEIKNNDDHVIKVKSTDGNIDIPIEQWKRLLKDNRGKQITFSVYTKKEEWTKYPDIVNHIAKEEIDSHLVYRLLYPGYELWNEMGIYQRNLESFDESPVVENKALEKGCVNCHSFAANSPDNMMFHVRGKLGGTVIINQKGLKKKNIKREDMPRGAVYPSWHPSGKYIAFSSNKIKQYFHAKGSKYIEVSDFDSDLILYDVDGEKVERYDAVAKKEYMETFPTWSPDGKYLYFTRAVKIPENGDIKDVRYNLIRVAVDAQGKPLEKPEVVIDAAAEGKSVAFPRISPNGKYLVYTLADYGNFTIWHEEADLYCLNLKTLKSEKLTLNSENVESYHSWSSNSNWMVFSSKRHDGHSALPYFAYIDSNGISHKPFVLPQRNPEFYNRFLKTYNIPEFIKSAIPVTEWQIVNTIRN